MSSIEMSLFGVRIELPKTAEKTQQFFEEAKAAGNHEGWEKHYRATACLLMGVASSFFNSLTYAGSALIESALIAPLNLEEAKNNFFEQGRAALNSLAFFSVGVFMTIGAIFAPDHVLEIIAPPGRVVGPREEPTEVSIDVNGTKLELPEDAKTTKHYFERAKAAENLEGWAKHYQATAYLLLGVAASFFNIFACSASALIESVLLIPLDSDRARENFAEEGFNVLNSIAYVAVGAILTLGSLFAPAQVLGQITIVNPNQQEDRVPPPNPNPVNPNPDPVNPDQAAQDAWMQQLLAAGQAQRAAEGEHESLEETFVMVSGAFQRFDYAADDIGRDVLEIMGEYYAAVFGADGKRQPTKADLPAMKALLAQIIFYNDYEEKFQNVLSYIQEEMSQVVQHCAQAKIELVKTRQTAQAFRAAQIEEDRRILEEQRLEREAMELKARQAQVFEEEKAAWQGLVDQNQGYYDELAAHVPKLQSYKQAWDALRAKKGNIGNKRELNHWITHFEKQFNVPKDVEVDVMRTVVNPTQRNAIALQYANKDYSQLENVETERAAFHQRLDTLERQINDLAKDLPDLYEKRARWEQIKGILESLPEDKSLVEPDVFN